MQIRCLENNALSFILPVYTCGDWAVICHFNVIRCITFISPCARISSDTPVLMVLIKLLCAHAGQTVHLREKERDGRHQEPGYAHNPRGASVWKKLDQRLVTDKLLIFYSVTLIC